MKLICGLESGTVQKGSDARRDEDGRETVRSQGTSNARPQEQQRRWAFFNDPLLYIFVRERDGLRLRRVINNPPDQG